MLKKLLTSIMLMLLISVSAAVAAPIDVEPEDADFDEISVVTSLGIMDVNEDSVFRGDDLLTRAELARIAIVLNGVDVPEASAAALYDDVDADNEYGKYIVACKDYNLMVGVQDRMFNPEGNVTREQLNAVILRVLGCEQFAKVMGGYTTGYTEIASYLGINSYLRYDGEFVTRRSAAVYLYEILDTPVPKMWYNDFKGIEFSNEGSKTLIEERMNIRKLEGTVTGNEISAIPGGSEMIENYVQVADEIMNVGSTDIMSKLGRWAEVYVSLDGDGNPDTLLSYILPEKRNNELIVKAKDINPAATDSTQICIDYEGKSKTYQLDGSKTVILNGEVLTTYTDTVFRIVRGELTMVDTTNNGKYDLIIIEEPMSVVFNRYSADTGTMSFKYGALPIQIADNAKIEVYIDDAKSDEASLKEWMSLFIYKPQNSEYYIIKASSKNVKGTLTALSGEGNAITVDGVEYYLAYDYAAYSAQFGTVELGNAYTFLITPYGEVIGIMKVTSARAYTYAYLTGGYIDSLTEEAYLRVFTEQGVQEKLKVKTKFKFHNGTTATKEDADNIKNVSFGLFGADGKAINQLICYKLDAKGEISEIKVAMDMTAGGTTDEEVFTKDYQRKGFASTDYDSIRYNTFVKMYHLAEDIVIFQVPGKNVGGVLYPADDLSDIRIDPSTKYSSSSAASVTNFELYDVDSFRRASVMVRYVVEGSRNVEIRNSELVLVSDIELSVLPSGDVGYLIKGYQDGKAIELTATPDLISNVYTDGQWQDFENTPISEIKPGHVINVAALNNNIDEFLVIGDLSILEFDHERLYGTTLTTAQATLDRSLVTIPGKVKDVDGTYVVVSTRAGNGEACDRVYNIRTGTEVYIYDSFTDEVTIGDYNSIVPDDKVFVRTREMETRTVIVVR